MKAVYNLRTHLASFEFFNWLVMVKADGATEIVFDIANPKLKNFHDVLQRYESILKPGAALADLPWRQGSNDGGLDAVSSHLLPWVMSGRTFSRLLTVKPAIRCKYTVTIRDNADGAKSRNSNREAWTRFAEEIGAVLIDDYFFKPIHLHDRMALYAGAEMNFGVCNGPIHTISLTPYPVTMFINSDSARNSQVRWGMRPDEKYPWMLPNQSMVWKDDNLDNLRRRFEATINAR